MLILRDIAAQAEAVGGVSLEDFWSFTYVRGTVNAHLAKPGSRFDGPGAPVDPRALDGEVRGEFLTFWYWRPPPGMRARLILQPWDSLADVDKAIVGRAGVLNTWTGFLLAYVGGKQRGYKVRSGSGELLARNGVRVCPRETAMATPEGERYVFWGGGE